MLLIINKREPLMEWSDNTIIHRDVLRSEGLLCVSDNTTLDRLSDFMGDIKSFKTWKDVKDDTVIHEYRATPDDWCGKIKSTVSSHKYSYRALRIYIVHYTVRVMIRYNSMILLIPMSVNGVHVLNWFKHRRKMLYGSSTGVSVGIVYPVQ